MAVPPTGTAPLPPPPVSLPSAPPGSHPIWPRGVIGTGPAYPSASSVAADFATEVLGIADPTVNEPLGVSASGIGTVTISVPAGDRALAVLTQRQVDGNWTITQVGDQSRLEGITMLPGGKPGPVMAIHPPPAATAADVTEVTADRTYEIHLTAQDLRAEVAHLVAPESLSVLLGSPIHNVLTVYRDRANRAIDALGGEFG
ncbi:MAG: hypothetical protein QOJ23_3657 [Actinomycetota bacterium]|nr:hypothetical protein [Actinomycetota bacterium]